LGPFRRTALVLAAAAAALTATACGKSSGTSAAKVQAGASLFAQNCAVCHGQNGRGGTAPVLDAKEMLSVATDQQLTNIIRVGIPGTQMRSWSRELGGPFDDKSVGELVAYLRSLEPNAPSVPNWRQGAAATSSTTSSSTP
jgi:cytochrome c oxidase cbb3-type subunit 3